MRKTAMMALRDSERASLGKHFNIIGASFVFVYPFPFTHFSRRFVSFCTLNYVPPLPVSFLSSNTLPIIRHSAFPGVAEYFSSGENYFFSLKNQQQQQKNSPKKQHQDFAPFLFQGVSAARSAITFQNCFHRHFLKTDYQIKC